MTNCLVIESVDLSSIEQQSIPETLGIRNDKRLQREKDSEDNCLVIESVNLSSIEQQSNPETLGILASVFLCVALNPSVRVRLAKLLFAIRSI